MKKTVAMILSLAMVFCIGTTGCGKSNGSTNTNSTESGSVTSQQDAGSQETSESTDASNSSEVDETSGQDSSSDAGDATSDDKASSKKTSKSTDDKMLSGKHHVKIVVKDYGTIAVELDADVAPISVTNFVNLAKSGFYDGLTFHRIISGFMIQGGDPSGNGTGGSDQTIKGEFAENGVENSISHKRGVISMARAQDYDSASSQFFIMHEDNEGLDGQYAAFGHVTSGMKVVDQICEKTPVTDSNGTVEPDNQPVIKKITVVD